MHATIVSCDLGFPHSTPAYLIDIQRIGSLLLQVSSDATSQGISLLAAAKAMPEIPEFLDVVSRHVVGFDVSNPCELDAVASRYPGHFYSYSSPGVLPKEFPPNGIFVATTPSQLEWVRENEKGFKGEFGIRLAYSDSASTRFGCDLEEVKRVMALPGRKLPNNVGFHVHGGLRRNAITEFLQRLSFAQSTSVALGVVPAFINIGGGLSALRNSDVRAMFEVVRRCAGNTPLFVEPGDKLSQGAITAVGRVLDVRTRDGVTAVVTDLSSEVHLRWSRVPRSFDGDGAVIVYGPTCFEDDYLGKFASDAGVRPGDLLFLGGISSYSVVWNGRFNGIERAAIYLDSSPEYSDFMSAMDQAV